MNPEIPEAWNNKGVALHRLGRAEEALECYERSLTIDPENMDALRNKGFVLRYLGRLEEALQAYDSVLQKGGEPLDMESTASVLAAMGRLEEALECMLLAREAAPIRAIRGRDRSAEEHDHAKRWHRDARGKLILL